MIDWSVTISEIQRRGFAVFARPQRFSFRSQSSMKSLGFVDQNPLSEGQNNDTVDDASSAHAVRWTPDDSLR